MWIEPDVHPESSTTKPPIGISLSGSGDGAEPKERTMSDTRNSSSNYLTLFAKKLRKRTGLTMGQNEVLNQIAIAGGYKSYPELKAECHRRSERAKGFLTRNAEKIASQLGISLEGVKWVLEFRPSSHAESYDFLIKGVSPVDISVRIPAGSAPLFCMYPGQNQAQDAFVYLDPSDKRIILDYTGEIGNAVPAAVWHNRIWTCAIPNDLSQSGCRQLVDEIMPLVKELFSADNFYIEWDGSNNVGRFSERGRALCESIIEICDADVDKFDRLNVWEAAEWYEGEIRKMLPEFINSDNPREYIKGLIENPGEDDVVLYDNGQLYTWFHDLSLIEGFDYSGKPSPKALQMADHLEGRSVIDAWSTVVSEYPATDAETAGVAGGIYRELREHVTFRNRDGDVIELPTTSGGVRGLSSPAVSENP
jgi:hypothetical protein